jgi:hypothetical protein
MKSFRTRIQALVTLSLLLGVLLGCGLLKKKPDAAASASAAVVAAPPVTPPAASVALAKPEPPEPPPVPDEAVPTAEDFEDEAFEQITDKTYKAEVDTLRKELEAK